MDALARLKDLLRSLFQYDLADLDFGIYRLLRLKRDQVDAFLNDQLPRTVDEAFQLQADESRKAAEERVGALAQRIREQIAEYALDEDGNVKPEYASVPARAVRSLVEQYDAARQALRADLTSDEAKAEVFNHLYAFFSRYYEDGDFIPKRRYGARETYAVPYNGEEVFFTWANRDQHYVKSGERFRDYAFTVPTTAGEYRVRFHLVEATATPGNAKGDTRYFFPLPGGVQWDADAHTLRIPFEYRVPTEEEAEMVAENGAGRVLRGQEAILVRAEPALRAAIPDGVLAVALGRPASDDGDSTLLLKRLRHFAKRNTSDFFIHKNLRAFLEQELEFYIKDQFLHLDDMYGDMAARLRALRVLRRVATDVIAFLAQIEEFQKRVFEKRKLVLRTDYLAPIQNVPRDLWPAVLANQRQIEEWRRLYAIAPKRTLSNPTGDLNEQFLEEHPTLVVNTAHFDEEFVLQLLAGFDDLDEATDGLLIHSENYQALRLLLRRYAGQVQCVYIDPPYNTGNDGFAYKDRYQHGSWLAMMDGRLRVARDLMSDAEGSIFISIDDGEQHRLCHLAENLFGRNNFVANIIWQKKYSPQNDARWLSDNHDFVLCVAKNKEGWRPGLLPRTDRQDERYQNPDNDPRGPWKPSGLDVKTYSREYDYEITTPSGRVVNPPAGRCWRTSKARLQELIADNRIWFGPDGNNVPAVKRFLSEVKQGLTPLTIWPYNEVGHNQEAAQDLKAMLSDLRAEDVFGTPKPTRLIQRVLAIGAGSAGLVLDYFAGSGTTGHAVINLNRHDGGRRKFILVEMADYFDTVLIPRIMKVMYAPDWKDGKPVRPATDLEAKRTPRLVKLLRLESYEDALHNLTTHAELERHRQRERAARDVMGDDAYRLRYLVRFSPEDGDSLLHLAKLEHPFSYTLETLTDNGPRTARVDLVETFNYLLGLRVHRIETWTHQADGGRHYRVVRATDAEGRHVLVLWRDMAALNPERERRFLEQRIADAGPFHQVWINGDSAVKGACSLDAEFARLMEEQA